MAEYNIIIDPAGAGGAIKMVVVVVVWLACAFLHHYEREGFVR
jgi:hypothetical protein